jgi:hypothetical protein
MARPDLHVVQGFFTTEEKLTFLFGVGGEGVRSFSAPWDDKLYELVYAFLWRLYEPGTFADDSFVRMDPTAGEPKYTVRIRIRNEAQPHDCHGFRLLFASNPFGTRTQILANPSSNIEIDGEPLTILKVQLCRVGTRFNEHLILSRIHTPQEVPGVVKMVYSDVIEVPHLSGRVKYRTGLRESGHTFSSIPNLRKVLEISYDLLEGALIALDHLRSTNTVSALRYLRFGRQILHCDISSRNVLFNDENPLQTASSVGPSRMDEDGNMVPRPCFIQHLLGETYVDVVVTTHLLMLALRLGIIVNPPSYC